MVSNRHLVVACVVLLLPACPDTGQQVLVDSGADAAVPEVQ